MSRIAKEDLIDNFTYPLSLILDVSELYSVLEPFHRYGETNDYRIKRHGEGFVVFTRGDLAVSGKELIKEINVDVYGNKRRFNNL
jgi:hypothetical protein